MARTTLQNDKILSDATKAYAWAVAQPVRPLSLTFEVAGAEYTLHVNPKAPVRASLRPGGKVHSFALATGLVVDSRGVVVVMVPLTGREV